MRAEPGAVANWWSLKNTVRDTRNPTQRELERQNDEAQNEGRGPQADRPPGLMILCFIILPNLVCRNSARPAKKQNVSSTENTAEVAAAKGGWFAFDRHHLWHLRHPWFVDVRRGVQRELIVSSVAR